MFKKEHIPYRDVVLSALALAILYCFYPKLWILIAIAAILVIGIIFPVARSANQKMWTGITVLMSKIFPPIFLTVIFFLIVVPVGFLFKLFRKSESKTLTSNFNKIEEKIDVSFFERVW